MRILIFAFVSLLISTTHGFAQDDSNHAYAWRAPDSTGNAVFIRGGYIFASHGGGGAEESDAPMAALGYRGPITSGTRQNVWSWETELFFARDSEDIAGLFTVDGYLLNGFASIRWDYKSFSGIGPYLSAGIGPSYIEATLSDATSSFTVSDWAFGYTGRAGVRTELSKRLSLDLGYRYLGVTDAGTAGLHAAEIGFNFDF